MTTDQDRRPSNAWLPERKRRGWRRLLASFRYSGAGFWHAVRHEAAVREVFAASVVLTIISLWLPVSRIEHLLLVVSLLWVLMMEFVNSSLEMTLDRVSLERHPLAGRAKDLGSAAVAVAALIAGLCWLVILGPVVAAWLRH